MDSGTPSGSSEVELKVERTSEGSLFFRHQEFEFQHLAQGAFTHINLFYLVYLLVLQKIGDLARVYLGSRMKSAGNGSRPPHSDTLRPKCDY